MTETIIIVVQRVNERGRKRRTVQRAIDGVALDGCVSPKEMLWWQLERCRRELCVDEQKQPREKK